MKKIIKLIILILFVFVTANLVFATSTKDTFNKDAFLYRLKTMQPVTSYPITASIDDIDTVTFGRYLQYKDQYGIYNKEPVEWILVDRDEENALLMSKYILDAKKYNIEKPDFSDSQTRTYIDVASVYGTDWYHATLRKWMNETMFSDLFNESEKSIINVAYLDNTYEYDSSEYEPRGNWSRDNLFLLNDTEFFYFFGKNDVNENSKIKATRATEYVNKEIGLRSKGGNEWHGVNSTYFLRLSGMATIYPIGIMEDGSFRRKEGINIITSGVRPCVFVKIGNTMDMARIDMNKKFRQETNNSLPIDAYAKVKMGTWYNYNDQPIDLEWYVVKEDSGKKLLLCKNVVKRMAFYKDLKSADGWSKSDVRRYLNDDFFNAAFSNEEKNKIVAGNIKTDPVMGVGSESWTYDKIFLLSSSEVAEYIGVANKNILMANDLEGQAVMWYLRNMGDSTTKVAGVRPNGDVDLKGSPMKASRYIRPAMWISE